MLGRWLRLRRTTTGIALLSLMLGLVILEVMTALALPNWAMWAQRERELELLWRGCQYKRAIQEFHRWCGRYPQRLDELLDKSAITGCDVSRPGFPARFLRRAYPEPFQGQWKWICTSESAPCPGPTQLIKGVQSPDPGAAVIVFSGRARHDEWRFEYNPGSNPTPDPCQEIPLE